MIYITLFYLNVFFYEFKFYLFNIISEKLIILNFFNHHIVLELKLKN